MMRMDRIFSSYNREVSKKVPSRMVSLGDYDNGALSDSISQCASSLGSTSSFLEDYIEDNDFEEINVTVSYLEKNHQITIDENLSALDFCHLLKLKLELDTTAYWFIAVKLPEEDLERILEDWEEVLTVYKRFRIFKCIFVLKQGSEVHKYDFFNNWNVYFPHDMISFHNGNGQISMSGDKEKKKRSMSFGKKSQIKMNDIQTQLNCFDKLRVIVSGKLMKHIDNEKIKDVIEVTFNTEDGILMCSNLESGQKSLFHVNSYQCFTPSSDSSPNEYGFCLIVDKDARRNYYIDNNDVDLDDEFELWPSDLIWFYANSETERNCWVTVLKLSKYGLREYRSCYNDYLRRKEVIETISPLDYVEMNACKALVDYTHGPRETRGIVVISNKGKSNREWKTQMVKSNSGSSSSSSSPGNSTPKSSTSCSPSKYYLDSSKSIYHALKNSHASSSDCQPWLYGNMSRDEAIKLLTKYETIDGVFLVRGSTRDPFSYVLSFVCNHKVFHCQIKRIEMDDTVCLTLDYGATKFYDLQQLVEFYQLNSTCLPTRLTHFVVHKPSSTCWSPNES